MYLARTLTQEGHAHRMVGAIDGDVVMHERPVGARLRQSSTRRPRSRGPAERPASARSARTNSTTRAIENLPADTRFAYRVRRGHGVDGERDGIVTRNVLASFAHRRSTDRDNWAARFVEFVRASGYRQRRAGSGAWTAARHSAGAELVA